MTRIGVVGGVIWAVGLAAGAASAQERPARPLEQVAFILREGADTRTVVARKLRGEPAAIARLRRQVDGALLGQAIRTLHWIDRPAPLAPGELERTREVARQAGRSLLGLSLDTPVGVETYLFVSGPDGRYDTGALTPLFEFLEGAAGEQPPAGRAAGPAVAEEYTSVGLFEEHFDGRWRYVHLTERELNVEAAVPLGRAEVQGLLAAVQDLPRERRSAPGGYLGLQLTGGEEDRALLTQLDPLMARLGLPPRQAAASPQPGLAGRVERRGK